MVSLNRLASLVSESLPPNPLREYAVGIYDRPYYQDQQTGAIASLKSQSIVVKLILINAALWLLNGFTEGGIWLAEHMAVHSEDLFSPLTWWKMLSAAFAHDPAGPWHVFWNMYGLWLFGRDVEAKYGSREFLKMYLVFAVVASVAWAAIHNMVSGGHPGAMLGASGAVMAITAVFVLNFPHRKFMLMFIPFAIPAWALGLLYLGADLSGTVGMRAGSNVAFTAHLAGAAVGALYFFSGFRFNQLSFGQGGFGQGGFASKLRKPSFSRNKNLRVFTPDSNSGDLDRKADAVLTKLNKTGIESLTAAERKVLDAYSRRMKQKHR